MATQTLSQHSQSTLLRRALRGNSVFSLVSGAVFLVGAGPIAALLGVENATPIIALLGLGVIGFAAFLFMTTMKAVDLRIGRIVFALDALWVIASALILVADVFSLSTPGKWLVLILADVVLVFAALEYIGLRRAR